MLASSSGVIGNRGSVRVAAAAAVFALAFAGLAAAEQANASSTTIAIDGFGPTALAFDPSGNLFVVSPSPTDDYSGSMAKITPAGVSTTIFAPFAQASGALPGALAIDAAGNIFTANLNSPLDYIPGSVLKVTPAGVGTFLPYTGSSPTGIVLDPAGNAYVSDSATNTVEKITPAGVATLFGVTGTPGPGGRSYALAIDAAGNIYSANSQLNSVVKITPGGVSQAWAQTGSNPIAIAVDSAGNVYTANSGSNNVSKITQGGPNGGVSTILATVGKTPSGIAVDAAGNVYTANRGSNNVSQITPGGASKIIGTTGSQPVAVALDARNNVYVANGNAFSVSKIVPGAPDQPTVKWSASSKHKTATGLVVPLSGLRYSVSAIRSGVKKSGSCKATKIKSGKKKVSRVQCVIKLSKGTWSVSVTPKKGSLAGAPSVKSIKIK